jgi:hypothetical protein
VKPLKQPLCHAIFRAHASPVFLAFLEEKSLLKNFWPAEEPILWLLIFFPELGSTFAGTGTPLRVGVWAYRRGADWARVRIVSVQRLFPGGTK